MDLYKNKRGNSVIEIIVVIIIVTIGIVGAYGIINSGQKLSTTSENRIKAINIAREWLEAVENIRDTNWLKFSSDYDNCWKVKDYNVTCIWYTPPNPNILSGSNILVQSGVLWTLSGVSSPASIATAYTAYIDQFPVFLDSNGLTTTSGSLTMTKCTPSITTNCRSMFSREIQVINNPVDNDHMTIHSIVTWVDSWKTSWPYIIDLETTLTNWKKKF